MTQRYTVTFTVTVPLVINDPDALTRTRTPEWRETFYDLTEAGAIEVLARCVGILSLPLRRLNGWADLPDDAVDVGPVKIEMEGYERVEDGEVGR